MNWRRPAARPAKPAYAEFEPAEPADAEFDLNEAWPVVFRDCTGVCQLAHQPHEDHGDGEFLCHNCGHPPRA